jgi:hypothetical protein
MPYSALIIRLRGRMRDWQGHCFTGKTTGEIPDFVRNYSADLK